MTAPALTEISLTNQRPAIAALFEARRRIGIRNDELRARSGVAINSAQYWLAGRSAPTMGNLVAFARALGFEVVLRRERPPACEMAFNDQSDVMAMLLAERKRLGMSFLDLESRSGISVNAMFAWRAGASPQLANLVAFAGALGFEVVLRPISEVAR
ncbi:helix-turn-helix domain-containing protein [Rhodomicrobium lacus]|uniref:helix-turn-helix domain-containing protein n=1 Tax=Rhodomicrobium lacus TaxID=2498452 RepID=UPI000F8D2FC4|nr:helix-turn-helix transcriptional regulator [Rhodomicrobium lacus]